MEEIDTEKLSEEEEEEVRVITDEIEKIIDEEEKEGRMSYFKINCPFCEGHSVSDVIDSIEDVDGQWECSNGHQFVVKYLGKIE